MINEKQKYPTNKKQYDRNYLRAFGKKCGACEGTGLLFGGVEDEICAKCYGVGYVPKDS